MRPLAADVEASSSTTESQKRCASCSPRATECHATCSARPSASSHKPNSTVLPLPAGPQTSATPPGGVDDNTPNSPVRGTKPRTGSSRSIAASGVLEV